MNFKVNCILYSAFICCMVYNWIFMAFTLISSTVHCIIRQHMHLNMLCSMVLFFGKSFLFVSMYFIFCIFVFFVFCKYICVFCINVFFGVFFIFCMYLLPSLRALWYWLLRGGKVLQVCLLSLPLQELIFLRHRHRHRHPLHKIIFPYEYSLQYHWPFAEYIESIVSFRGL